MARFLIRRVLRSIQGAQLRAVHVLVCGYPPKGQAVHEAFRVYGQPTVCLYPHCATSADVAADLLDSKALVPASRLALRARSRPPLGAEPVDLQAKLA